jgi:hypothetical protein
MNLCATVFSLCYFVFRLFCDCGASYDPTLPRRLRHSCPFIPLPPPYESLPPRPQMPQASLFSPRPYPLLDPLPVPQASAVPRLATTATWPASGPG